MENIKTSSAKNLNTTTYVKFSCALFALIALYLILNPAMAESGSDVFGEIKKVLVDYMKGTLGSVIAISVILTGLFAAVKTQSLWSVAIGFVVALSLYYSPAIVDNVMDDTGAGVDTISVSNEVTALENTSNIKFFKHN